jgi:hypothetical protein
MPVPEADAATTLRDQAVTIPVTKNDTDPDPARLHVVAQPPNGHAEVNGATIVYTPTRGSPAPTPSPTTTVAA